MIVFASGKNRAVAGQELHTDFSLSSSGEYLALARPDGTVAQGFAPNFPTQLSDVSYGFAFNTVTNSFVISGAAAKWEIPRGAADFPANWPATNFDDSSWSNGVTGLGFSPTQTNLFGSGPATNVAPGKCRHANFNLQQRHEQLRAANRRQRNLLRFFAHLSDRTLMRRGK